MCPNSQSSWKYRRHQLAVFFPFFLFSFVSQLDIEENNWRSYYTLYRTVDPSTQQPLKCPCTKYSSGFRYFALYWRWTLSPLLNKVRHAGFFGGQHKNTAADMGTVMTSWKFASSNLDIIWGSVLIKSGLSVRRANCSRLALDVDWRTMPWCPLVRCVTVCNNEISYTKSNGNPTPTTCCFGNLFSVYRPNSCHFCTVDVNN